MGFTKLKNLQERLASLDLWKHSEKHKFNLEEFARAGFFFEHTFDTHDDPGRLRCAFCPAVIGNWQPEDDPWKEHILSVENCPHVVQYKGEEFVERVNQEGVETEEEMDNQDQDHAWKLHEGRFGLIGFPPSQLMSSEQNASSSSADRKEIFNQDMVITDVRLASFKAFQPNTRNHTFLSKLADSGFYFEGSDGHGVKVRCFCCGQALFNIDDNEDVWRTHAKMSDCEHVERRKGIKFIQEARVIPKEIRRQDFSSFQQRGKTKKDRDKENAEIPPGSRTRKRKESAERFHPENAKKTCVRSEPFRPGDGEDTSAFEWRPDLYWHKNRWLKVQWRSRKKRSSYYIHRQANASDGDMDWGGGSNEDKIVFLCCRLKICKCNDGRGPCPVCFLDK